MTPELDCLRKNFDVIAESIRNTLGAPARTIAAPSRDGSEETDRGTPSSATRIAEGAPTDEEKMDSDPYDAEIEAQLEQERRWEIENERRNG